MNIYKMVTDQILGKLSEGVVPWRRSWAAGLPCSLGSGKEYRGINVILLGLRDHTSRYWVTYKEAVRLKGFVNKGARGARGVFWKWRTEEELAQLKAGGKTNPAPCIPFLFSVFNLEQTGGLQAPSNDLKCERKEHIEEAEKIITAFSSMPSLAHGLHLQPCYVPLFDVIQLPHLSQFRSANHYYSTLFHEMVHATGHESRLNREMKGREEIVSYSFEELVAEIGSAFLCGFCGINNDRTILDQSSYISHWQEFLKSDSTAFMRACSEAQRAVDFIRGVRFGAEQETNKTEAQDHRSVSL
jgi:antirestriction protein ArdC